MSKSVMTQDFAFLETVHYTFFKTKHLTYLNFTTTKNTPSHLMSTECYN